MSGTIVNVIAVLAGGAIGIMVGRRLPERLMKILFHGLGLVTIVIGISMSLQSTNLIITVVSILLGALLGELANIERGLQRAADWLKKRLRFRSERFSEGFVTATVIYCVGSMTILGAIEDGLGQFPRLLYTKSVMDGLSSIALSATMGVGVLFSTIPLLLYQGFLTLGAGWASDLLTEPMIAEMSAAGGVILVGIGLNLLGLTKISAANFLPALVIAPLAVWLLGML